MVDSQVSEPRPGAPGIPADAEFWLDLGFEIGDYVEEALVEAAVGGDGFLDGDVGDVGALKDGDAAPLFVVDHVDGVKAVALAEDAVEGGRNAAALGVAEVDGAGLKAGFLFDELGEGFADAGEAGVAEGVDLRGADDLAYFRQVASFGNDYYAIVLAVVVVVLEQGTDVVDVDLFFRDKDDMSAAGNTGGVGDPAGVPEIRK